MKPVTFNLQAKDGKARAGELRTTRNVIQRGRSLEKAGGGKLLKWVKAEEARLVPNAS